MGRLRESHKRGNFSYMSEMRNQISETNMKSKGLLLFLLPIIPLEVLLMTEVGESGLRNLYVNEVYRRVIYGK